MPKNEINLLPQDDFEKQPFGKFLIWAMSAGRWIVIFVELIVLIAFFSRFKLDRDIADLYESIKQKQSIIASNAPFEKEFRLLQKRLAMVETIENSVMSSDKIIDAVAASTPADVALINLKVEEGNINITGIALSENGLGGFLKGLSQAAFFTDIELTNVTKKTDTEGGIKFVLNAKVKKAEKK